MYGVRRARSSQCRIATAALAAGFFWTLASQGWAAGGDPTWGIASGVKCRAGKCGVSAASEARPPAQGHRGPPPSGHAAATGGSAGPGGAATWKRRPGQMYGPRGIPLPGQSFAKPDGKNPAGKKGGRARPEPAVVAQKALRELVLPDPEIRTNPDEKHAQLVRVPTWMWLDRAMWKPVSETAKVPGVSVTATAIPRSATWRMGDGKTVVCDSAGTRYSAKYAADSESPDCGHTYLRSSAGRGGASCRSGRRGIIAQARRPLPGGAVGAGRGPGRRRPCTGMRWPRTPSDRRQRYWWRMWRRG